MGGDLSLGLGRLRATPRTCCSQQHHSKERAHAHTPGSERQWIILRLAHAASPHPRCAWRARALLSGSAAAIGSSIIIIHRSSSTATLNMRREKKKKKKKKTARSTLC